MLTNESKKLYQKRIEYCHFRICNSNFCLFLFLFSFFYRRYNVPGSHQALLQRHSLFLYRFFFWMPYSAIIGWLGRWLANHIQKISRCSMCRMQRLLSDFFPMTTVMLSFLISRNRLMSMHFFIIFHCFNIAWFHNK